METPRIQFPVPDLLVSVTAGIARFVLRSANINHDKEDRVFC
jgi:hypothetical protein